MAAVAEARRSPRTLFESVGGEPTLDELIAGVWEGLAARQPVECPVCGDAMEPRYAHHSRPIGGRCGGCGSILT